MVNKPRKRHNQTQQSLVPEKTPDQTVGYVPKEPLDIGNLPLDALRRYRKRYELPVKTPMTLKGYMLGGSVGKKTWSMKHLERSSEQEVADTVRHHFAQESVREGDTIAEFLYAVQHKDKEFKLLL